MENSQDWDDVRFWAQELDKKYPETDLISLSDENLERMILSLEAAEGMPQMPKDDVFFFAVKSAWSVVQYGFDDSGEVPDAYI